MLLLPYPLILTSIPTDTGYSVALKMTIPICAVAGTADATFSERLTEKFPGRHFLGFHQRACCFAVQKKI